MNTIEIDQDVMGHLKKNVKDFGDTPNSVLRRLLGLDGAALPAVSNPTELPIADFLASAEFRFARGAVGRFLALLSWLYRHHREAFKIVVQIRGRGRLYFSTSADELERSGKSVNPKQIPDSPYWVITTTPTNLKQEILGEVMKALKCDAASIRAATEAIEF